MRALLTALLLLMVTAPATAAEMRVEGTAIVVTDESGRERRGAELDGAELNLGDIGTLEPGLRLLTMRRRRLLPSTFWPLMPMTMSSTWRPAFSAGDSAPT